MSTLDAACYPHIFERVIASAPHDSLVRLRRVSRATKAAADARLFERVRIVRSTHYATHSLVALSFEGRRLPMGPSNSSDGLAPSAQWANVRILHGDASVQDLPEQRNRLMVDVADMPALHTLRQVDTVGELDTVVNVIRFPDPYCLAALPFYNARRHVFAVAYDPQWIVERDCSFHHLRVARPGDEVHIFLPTPTAWRPKGSLAPAMDATRFLHVHLLRAAAGLRERFIFVGVEALPRAVLVHYGFDDTELALDTESEEWVAAVRTRILTRIEDLVQHADSVRRGSRIPKHPDQAVEDYVEVLTFAEYRARVGEDTYELHTLADVDLAASR